MLLKNKKLRCSSTYHTIHSFKVDRVGIPCVAKNLPSDAKDAGSIPGQGIKTPQTTKSLHPVTKT